MSAQSPKWLLWAGIAFILWNLMGVGSFVNEWTIGPEALAKLPQAQQDMIGNMPGWLWAAFAFGVFGGLLGSIAVLLKKAWAAPVYLVSLIAVVLQFGYIYATAGKTIMAEGFAMAAFPALVIAIAAVQWGLARKWRSAGWLA